MRRRHAEQNGNPDFELGRCDRAAQDADIPVMLANSCLLTSTISVTAVNSSNTALLPAHVHATTAAR